MSTFDAAQREIGEHFKFAPPLVEVPIDELARQMEEQHDRYAAAKSEADQAAAVADEERAKLDEIMAYYFARRKAVAAT